MSQARRRAAPGLPVMRARCARRLVSSRRLTFTSRRLAWLALVGLLVLPACLPEPPPEPTRTPTATATVTPTATATIVWFPPTATPTAAPLAERTPTPDPRPATGELLLADDFSDTSQWPTSRSEVGSMAYGRAELTLAVAQPRGTLISLRPAPELGDFYLEIDAQPSLCRGADMYGLLLRAVSHQDFYRLLVNCAGQLRMERVKDGRFVVIADWSSSGQLLPGGMLPARIGVEARGKEIRIYLNDVFQFSFQDPVFARGTLGVFARSAGETPLTVSFSNLAIYNLD